MDVIEVLTDSPRARKYWNALKTKLLSEGSELSHFLGQLKMPSADGKMYLTDVADAEQLFRLNGNSAELKRECNLPRSPTLLPKPGQEKRPRNLNNTKG